MAAYCTNCATPLESGIKFCPSCGAQMDAPSAPPPPVTPSPTASVPAGAHAATAPSTVARRYPALRIVAIVLKIAAVVWVIIGVIGLIIAISAGSDLPSGMGAASGFYGFLVLLTCLYFAVMSWAGAELLQVFMDIEENTRRAAAH